jgi:hypothetical protein
VFACATKAPNSALWLARSKQTLARPLRRFFSYPCCTLIVAEFVQLAKVVTLVFAMVTLF